MPLFLEMLRSETAEDPARMRAALDGLAAYQNAPRIARADDRPVIARAGRAMLRAFGGEGPAVVFVPSLINPPHVLDLAPGNSLLEWLATQGLRPMLVDWGTPDAGERELSIAGHVERLLLPMIATLRDPPLLAGYCLGGTMAIAAAGLVPVTGLALLATPWRYGGFPDEALASLARIWEAAAPLSEALGLMPMEALQAAFWQMDSTKTITKFERFATLPPDGADAASFVVLEDWANAGPPLTFAAARELFIDLFGANRTGNGEWRVGGKIADPARIPCPILDIASTGDRIVPAASAARAGDHRLLAQGHVGMIVGRQARAVLWEPLAAWLKDAAGQPPRTAEWKDRE